MKVKELRKILRRYKGEVEIKIQINEFSNTLKPLKETTTDIDELHFIQPIIDQMDVENQTMEKPRLLLAVSKYAETNKK